MLYNFIYILKKQQCKTIVALQLPIHVVLRKMHRTFWKKLQQNQTFLALTIAKTEKSSTNRSQNYSTIIIFWLFIGACFLLLLFLDFPPTKQFQSDTDIGGIFFTFNSMLKKQKRGVILKTTGLIWKINQYDCVNFVKRSEHKSVPIHPPYSCVSVKCSRRGGAIRSYCEVVPVEDLLFWKLDDILHSHFCLFQKIQHLIMRNTNQ